MTQREIAIEILKRLQEAGHETYFVGGCVRDELCGVNPRDYDIATSAHPDEVEALFLKTVGVGKSFGVILVLQDGWQFEVATFRTEAGYQDGRRPTEIQFSDAKTDASRRDFTVNGLFLDPVTHTIYDWTGGQNDLRQGIIRTIGHPTERLTEDHLRLLRAIRFAAQLDYEIEPATFAAVRDHAPQIRDVSAERICEELCKLFSPPHAARGLDLLLDSGLLEYVLPELGATVDCEQSPDFHPEGTVFNHIRLMLSLMPHDSPPQLPWTIILHDIAKPVTRTVGKDGRIHFYGHEKIGSEMAGEILKRLRFLNRDIEAIVQTVYYHMQFKDAEKMRKATLRRMLLRPNFDLELEQHRLDCLGSHGQLDIHHFLCEQRVLLEEQPLLLAPLVNGKDLLDLGIESGPVLGQLLEEIRDKQLSEEFTSRKEVLLWVKEKTAL